MQFTGKTVDEAIENGLKELGIGKDDADVIVISEPQKGLFGKLKGEAVVDIAKKDDFMETEKKVEKTEKIEKTEKTEKSKKPKKTANDAEVKSSGLEEDFLKTLLKFLGVDAEIRRTEEEDKEILTLVSENSSTLIGYRGETLDAIQTLVGAVANIGNKVYKKVSVDCENYRGKREETLIKLAHKLEQKATEIRRDVQLEPMNPFERRIIHTALAESQTVTTKSEGNEPDRYVVIVPNDRDENSRPYNAGVNHGDRSHGKNNHKNFGNKKGGKSFSKREDKPKRYTPSGFGTYLGNSLKDKE